MLAPINYMLENKSPMDSFFGGVKSVQNMQQDNNVLRQQELVNEQQAAAQARKAQMEAELDQLDTTSIEAMRAFNAKYPDMAKGVQQAYDALDAKQKQNTLLNHSRIASLVKNGRPDAAIQMLEAQEEAYKNAGDEQGAQETKSMADLIRMSPEAAQATLTWGLSIMSPKDVADNYGNLSEAYIKEDAAPVDRAKTQAEADELTTLTPVRKDEIEAKTAGAYAGAKKDLATATNLDAKTTETLTLLPHEQRRVDSATSLNTANAGLAETRATDIPIARADAQAQQEVNNQIAQLKLQLQGENNSIARERLQVAIDKLEHTKAAYAAGLTTKQIETNQKNQKRLSAYDKNIDGINQTRSTITRLLNNKSGLRGAAGAIQGRLPSTRKDTLQFEKDLETLQSQVFLTQVEKMRGLGALTDFEGKKLESGIANLSLVQSEESLARNLAIVYDAMKSFEKAAQTEYADLLKEVSLNQTGSTAGRSYMQYAN